MARVLAVINLLAAFTMAEAWTYTWSPNYVLKEHNILRCMHGARPLAWNSRAAAIAQRWANHQRDNMVHGDHDGMGQNLYIGWTTGSPNANKCVDDWYSEIKYTPGGRGAQSTFGGSTGHYTQVVWKGTTSVGCGVWCGMSQGMHCCQVVCDYSPPGNYMGQFASNVAPIQKSRAQCAAEMEILMLAGNNTVPEGEFYVEDSTEDSTPAAAGNDEQIGALTIIGAASMFAIMAAVASYLKKVGTNRAETYNAMLG